MYICIYAYIHIYIYTYIHIYIYTYIEDLIIRITLKTILKLRVPVPTDEEHMSTTAFTCLPRNLVCSPPLLAYPFAVPHFCDLDCTLPLLTYPAPKYAFIYKTKVQLRESSEIKGTDHQAWRWSVPLICLGFLCLYPGFEVRKPWQSFRMA